MKKNKNKKSAFNNWLQRQSPLEIKNLKMDIRIAYVSNLHNIPEYDANKTPKQRQEIMFNYFLENIIKNPAIKNQNIQFVDGLPKHVQKTRKRIEKFNAKKKNPKDLSTDFYYSEKWLVLKNKVLRLYKCGCMKCGISGVEKHVDHIHPRSTHPYLELNIHNLQILCRNCNMEKSNKNTIDYRTDDQKKLCQIKYA